MPTPNKPKPEILWSDYFQDWLIVARVKSDTDWRFIRAEYLAEGIVMRAKTPLSVLRERQP